MKRAHRIALRPKPEQESLLNQQANYARFAYNWAVAEFKTGSRLASGFRKGPLHPWWNRVKRIIAL